MMLPTAPSRLVCLDDFVRAFEAARVRDATAQFDSFLPPHDDPLYRDAVRELARVEMEHDWNCGRPRRLNDYRNAFPDVFAELGAFAEIALEEYRLRREHGEQTMPDEYARVYGVATDGWPTGPIDSVQYSRAAEDVPARTVVTDAAQRLLVGAANGHHQHAESNGNVDPLDPGAPKTEFVGDAAEIFRAIQDADPAAADRLASATAAMPRAGQFFLGFRLIDELGRGAFGRVFLAFQGDLANRPVALKITADLRGEPQTLAQLQHTNIVPVYSIHGLGAFHAVCMPYFGRTTLADVIDDLHDGTDMPTSAKDLFSTRHGRKCRTRDEASPSGSPSSHPGRSVAPVQRLEGGSQVPLAQLEGRSYVDAVLWVGARLADGLAHAHERGILHRDLKPANVLLTDDGQPMLLDFNLAADTKPHAAVASMGGTLPYMAPEQLEAFVGNSKRVDHRSDVYALGLILFELLTGRMPFAGPSKPVHSGIPRMIAERRQPPPRLCTLNRAVTPAVESIIRHCLEPNPAHRYLSARELQDDLERQLAHQPLRFAAEPSWRESAWKWVRRHPRLASSSTVAAVATVLFVATATGAAMFWRNHQAGLEAVRQDLERSDAAGALTGLVQTRHVQLALQNDTDRAALVRIASLSRDALAQYGLPDNPDWQDQPRVTWLGPADKSRLNQDASATLLAWAEAESSLAVAEASSEKRTAALTRAWDLNAKAEVCLDGQTPSRALWAQRARLADLLGRDDAAELQKKADKTPLTTADDHVHAARPLMRQREFRKAMPLLVEAARLDPRHFWAWQFLGNCYYDILQYHEALACFSAAASLVPDPSVAYFPYYFRALVHADRGRTADAEADLNRAIKALDDLPPLLKKREEPRPYLELAKLLTKRKDYPAAEAALTKALAFGTLETQILFERARVRELRKDAGGAMRDREDGFRRTPTDERDWSHRGLARLSRDPQAALADFEEALKLNPSYFPALQNKSHVLSERLNRVEEAIRVLDRIVELYPGYVKARIGRGVLLARIGRREKAHEDARESLARDRSPPTLYQAADIYALTARQVQADREWVIPLLSAALWGGFGLDEVDHDTDLDPVRDLPGLKKLIEVVREFQADPRTKPR